MSTEFQRDYIYTIPESVFDDRTLEKNHLKIYMFVRAMIEGRNKSCWASNGWFANKLNIDRRSVIRCINHLIARGHLIKKIINDKRYLDISRTPLLYTDEPDCSDGVVTQMSPPRDTDVTPPSDTDVTQTNNSYINNLSVLNKPLKKELKPPEYKETLYMPDTSLETKKISDQTFNLFFSIYPIQKKENRARCAWYSQRCFEKAHEIISNLKNQIDKDSDFKDGYAPNPDTYILEERWKDKPIQRKSKRREHGYQDNSWAEDIEKDAI